MVTNILRWIIAVPAGLLLWFAANYSIGMAFGFLHGFETVDSFWEALDMNGMPISGTYIILVTRIVAAASLVGMIIYVVPRYHKQVAIVVASLVSAAAVGFLGFILFQAMSADLNIGLDGWYRHILDMLSIILGGIVGAWVAYGNQKNRAHA
jgi:glucan phosphoethanolaminetransferase (alkaline phosphatase superfamily)